MISAMVMSFAHKHWPKKPPKVIVHKDQALINRFIPKFSLQLLEIFLNELCRTWPEMMQLKIEICSTPFQPRNFSWAVNNNSQIKSQVCCHQCSHWSHSNHSDLSLCCQDLSWLGKSNPIQSLQLVELLRSPCGRTARGDSALQAAEDGAALHSLGPKCSKLCVLGV